MEKSPDNGQSYQIDVVRTTMMGTKHVTRRNRVPFGGVVG